MVSTTAGRETIDMNEQQLRTLIQAHIHSGRLPCSSARHRLFTGSGGGGLCHCCGQPILSAHLQYNVACYGTKLMMHLHCYDEWRQVPAALNAAPLAASVAAARAALRP
jgi:hypothetical protein